MFNIPGDLLNKVIMHVHGAKGQRQQMIVTAIQPMLANECEKWEVDTEQRFAAFIGQCIVECDEFCTLEEYASGEAYEGRKNLGNTEEGDGVKFKGRGVIQLTGRKNYTNFMAATGADVIAHPEWLSEQPHLALTAALWFWKENNLNLLADDENIEGITKKVNGGTTALERRQAATDKVFEVLGFVAKKTQDDD